MNPQLKLLSKLAKPGVALTDAAGLPVSPRTQMEIASFASAIRLRHRMAAIEATRHFPILSRLYRELREQFSVHVGLLEGFLADVSQKLASKQYQIKEEKNDRL